MYIQGTVKEDKRSPTGFELSVKELEIVGESVDFPITKDYHYLLWCIYLIEDI